MLREESSSVEGVRRRVSAVFDDSRTSFGEVTREKTRRGEVRRRAIGRKDGKVAVTPIVGVLTTWSVNCERGEGARKKGNLQEARPARLERSKRIM